MSGSNIKRIHIGERINEIERFLPPKSDGQEQYQSTHYRHLEEVIGICQKQQQQILDLQHQVKTLRYQISNTKRANSAQARWARQSQTSATNSTTEHKAAPSPRSLSRARLART